MDIIMKFLILVNVIVAFCNSYIYFKDWKKGLFIYCILACLWPLTRIGNIILSYEILGFCFLLPSVFFRFLRFRDIIWRKEIFLYIIWVIYILVVTLVSVLRHGANINFILIFSYFRYCILLLLFLQENIAKNYLKYFFEILVPINFIVCLIQAYIPGSYIVFCNLYVKRQDIIPHIEANAGNYGRLYGTFSICTQLSIFALMATVFYSVYYLFKNNSAKTLLYLIISIIIGIGSASKMYFLGSFVLILYLICGIMLVKIVNIAKRKRVIFLKKVDLMKFIQICCGILLIVFCTITFSKSVYIKYYWDASFANFTKSMGNRFAGITNFEEPDDSEIDSQLLPFDESTGTTVDMLSSLDKIDRIIGVGATRPYNEFVGDSEWLMLYHHSGIVGICILSIWILLIVFHCLKNMQVDTTIYICLIILGAIGLLLISSIIGIMILSYIIANQKNKEWLELLFSENT